MKRWRRDILAVLLIAGVVVLFFLPLFWPTQQLLVTPDFGKSDAWHFSFATKYALWESLHKGTLPLWSDNIGGGFPLFAEGQVGAFFLPNLFLFKFLHDPVLAYNLSLVLAIVILSTGTYVWLRALALSRIPSVFGSLTFTLSGIVILQLPHITLLQGFSLLPWMAALIWVLLHQPTRPRIAVAAFVFSQQMLAGFPQATFLSVLFCSGLIIWHTWQSGKWRWSPFFLFTTIILLALGLSAVQLIPSFEFLQQTALPRGLPPDIASYFSFPLSHLASFVAPFALGDPRSGTYPHFSEFNGSIFWENTGYIGLLPLILLIPAIIKKNPLLSYCLSVLLSAFLLMWGSASPLYVVYSFWPFNLFRVPSRFLWIFVFSLVTLASTGFHTLGEMTRKKIHRAVSYALVVVHVSSLFLLWRNYHLLVPAKPWMSPPAIVNVLPKSSRIFTIGSEQTHNRAFLSTGWLNPGVYETLREALSADSNILWGVTSHNVYAGRTLRRSDIADTLLTSQIHITSQTATMSAVAQKLFNIFGITHLISSMPLSQEKISPKPVIFDTVSPDGSAQITLSVNTTAVPRVYLAASAVEVTSVEQAEAAITDDSFLPGYSVLVEQPLQVPDASRDNKATIVSNQPTRVTVSTSSPVSTLLVLGDTYYPGWRANVDNTPVSILPVNIRYRGVLVPAGEHNVEFGYHPKSLTSGVWISAVSFVILVALAVFPDSFAAFRTGQKGRRRAPSPPSSLGGFAPRKERG